MTATTVMTVFGTRPEAIKLAMLIRGLQRAEDFRPVTVVTAQHREMLDQVLSLFELTVDHDLDLMSPRQSLTDITTKVLSALVPVIQQEAPDLVVVQGDTTTTFAAALAGFYHRVPVVHLEAGLRTGDPMSPFPEEINRRLTSQLTTLHLAPTPQARQHLLDEGVQAERICVTGNTVIDALRHVVPRVRSRGNDLVGRLGGSRMLLVTAHRRESWGDPMRQIGVALHRIARRYPDLQIVFPMHLNPVVRDAIGPAVEGLPNVHIIDPLPYGPFVWLMNRSSLILTDSGGVQEEGPSLGKPVLVMRDTTERPEAVASGTARLVGTGADRIVDEVVLLLDDDAHHRRMSTASNPYGDGHAVPRAIGALRHLIGTGPTPQEFVVDADA